MNGSERLSPYAAQIQSEHRELHRSVGEIGRVFVRRDGCESQAECRDRYRRLLATLREHLAKHFAEEEGGGYMEEAVSAAPQLAAEATELEREHPAILQTLDRIVKRLKREDLPEHDWAEAGLEFKRFARLLLSHEARENRLLQSGFNADLELEVD